MRRMCSRSLCSAPCVPHRCLKDALLHHCYSANNVLVMVQEMPPMLTLFASEAFAALYHGMRSCMATICCQAGAERGRRR